MRSLGNVALKDEFLALERKAQAIAAVPAVPAVDDDNDADEEKRKRRNRTETLRRGHE